MMKGRKREKQTKKEKRPYFIVQNGTDWKTVLSSLNVYNVVSVDPGIKNLGFRIEKRVREKNDPKFCEVETIVMENLSFSTEYGENELRLFHDITIFLDSYYNIFKDVCLFIIEDQQVLETGAYFVIKIAQHIMTYFSLLSRTTGAVVAAVSPKLKRKILSDKGGMERSETVKWQNDEGKRILRLRNDEYALQICDHFRKTDDMMVTVLQTEAVFRHLGLPVTRENNDFIFI